MKLISIAGTTAAAKDQLAADWQLGRAADYAAWQADKAAGTPTSFTDAWLTDRATLLQAVVARNEKDGDGLAYSPEFPTDRASDLRWTDAAGADQVLVAENTARQGGVLRPVAMQMLAFGGAGADSFTGNDNRLGDHLYGDAGDDTLDGRGGNDYLEGDAGDDVLVGGAGKSSTRTQSSASKRIAGCRSTTTARRRFAPRNRAQQHRPRHAAPSKAHAIP